MKNRHEDTEEETTPEVFEVEGLLDDNSVDNGGEAAQRRASNRQLKTGLTLFLHVVALGTTLGCLSGYTWNHSRKDNVATKPTHSVLSHSEIAARQIENYRRGNGLVLNLHITHHGGTAFCAEVGQKLRTPEFACMGFKDKSSDIAQFLEHFPWSHNDTASSVEFVSQYLDVISWEFAAPPSARKGPTIPDTNWEDPHLVSVIVMRDPISRLLAGDGYTLQHYPGIAHDDGTATHETWWGFARDDKMTNNIALHVLAGETCCQGNYTDPIHLETAKNLVSRFTFVLDIACLTDGMQALSDRLGMNLTVSTKSKSRFDQRHKKTSRERIGYEDVYEYLLEKNKLDIELYDWSKNLALVDCSTLV